MGCAPYHASPWDLALELLAQLTGGAGTCWAAEGQLPVCPRLSAPRTKPLCGGTDGAWEPPLRGPRGCLPLLLAQFPWGKELPQTERMGNESQVVQEERLQLQSLAGELGETLPFSGPPSQGPGHPW